jgi:hypothetical protein
VRRLIDKEESKAQSDTGFYAARPETTKKPRAPPSKKKSSKRIQQQGRIMLFEQRHTYILTQYLILVLYYYNYKSTVYIFSTKRCRLMDTSQMKKNIVNSEIL